MTSNEIYGDLNICFKI